MQYVKSEDLCDGGTWSGNENVLEMERDSVAWMFGSRPHGSETGEVTWREDGDLRVRVGALTCSSSQRYLARSQWSWWRSGVEGCEHQSSGPTKVYVWKASNALGSFVFTSSIYKHHHCILHCQQRQYSKLEPSYDATTQPLSYHLLHLF